MVTNDAVRQLALALPETTEQPHFEKTSFRIKKKIFATLTEEKRQAVLKLNETDQDIFTVMSKGSVYPVPGGWGKKGWTLVELEQVEEALFKDALETAYKTVA